MEETPASRPAKWMSEAQDDARHNWTTSTRRQRATLVLITLGGLTMILAVVAGWIINPVGMSH